MKTIEERAKEYAQKAFPYSPYYFEATRKEYIKIITEQRDIDIEKAWSLANSMYQTGKDNLVPLTKDEFIKAMKE